jgi:hypothetical protein
MAILPSGRKLFRFFSYFLCVSLCAGQLSGRCWAQDGDSVPAVKLQAAVPATALQEPDGPDAAQDAALQTDETAKANLPLQPTHKQVKTIRPSLIVEEGAERNETQTASRRRAGGDLKTFCLAYDGTILAGLARDGLNAIQMLSPDGDVQKQINLQFEPHVITQAPNGTIFVAGPGKLAKLSTAGEVVTSVDAPWLGDPEELKKEIKEDMKKQYASILESLQSTLDQIDARIEKLEAEMEEETSERTEKRLQALKEQREPQAQQLEAIQRQLDEDFDVASMIAYRLSSTGIAANNEDLFVCASGKGFRYEVWRMDHDFGSPEKVIGGLSGCCGQCDIQCDEENLIVAANTEFAVQLRTRDGKAVSKFGKRGGQDGFGSCCNPMNVKVLPSGEILTAESSIGWIKRFSRDGELLGVIGKAKIGGGCKHVPIGYNQEIDRYYMQYEDRFEICVLDPITSIVGLTEDEQAAKEAREVLGQKLVGKWKNDETPKATGGLLVRLLGGGDSGDSASVLPSSMEFAEDGKMVVKGGQYGMGGEGRWEAVRQSGNTLTIERLDVNESGFNFEIEFKSDDVATFKLMMDTYELGRGKFKRVGSKSATDEEDEATDPSTTESSSSSAQLQVDITPDVGSDRDK